MENEYTSDGMGQRIKIHLFIALLLMLGSRGNAQQIRVILVDVDSVLEHSLLYQIETIFTHKAFKNSRNKLVNDLKILEQDVKNFTAEYENCCSCDPSALEQKGKQLILRQDRLATEEQALLQMEKQLNNRYKQLISEFVKSYYQKHFIVDAPVINSSKSRLLYDEGVTKIYLTNTVISELNKILILMPKAAMFNIVFNVF